MILSALAAATIIATCPWPNRGFDPYMGDVPAAVDTYTDIPAPVRSALKAKMALQKYDDIAHITGAGITSQEWVYGPLTMMHFGDGKKLCATVDTSMWPATDSGERALIYCVDGYCIGVPTVCRNVSRIERVQRRYAGLRMSIMGLRLNTDREKPVDVPIPPIEAPEPSLDLPRQPFARLADPDEGKSDLPLPPSGGDEEKPWWLRIRAGLSFWDLVQWRPLLPVIAPPFVVGLPVELADGRMGIPSAGIGAPAPVIGDGIVIDRPAGPIATAPDIPAQTPMTGPVTAPSPPAGPGIDVGDSLPQSAAVVPEPSTYALFALGLAMLWVGTRRKRG